MHSSLSTMNSPKYNFKRNPIYQIDHSISAKGKRLGLTKRTVIFKFGFSNADAIAGGAQGVSCRGEEHEISMTWSITSGKRTVKFDNSEVHFSQGKRSEMKFECSFTILGHHLIKLIAHVASPVMGSTPGFRQFDLFLDGMSFFDFP